VGSQIPDPQEATDFQAPNPPPVSPKSDRDFWTAILLYSFLNSVLQTVPDESTNDALKQKGPGSKRRSACDEVNECKSKIYEMLQEIGAKTHDAEWTRGPLHEAAA
jgi:hypothetical protein